MADRLEAALALRELGWNVVAAPRGGKSPLGQWKRWQSETIPERAVREAFEGTQHNLFVITGAVSQLAVLDCDDEEAVKYWRERLGDVLEETSRVRTGSGYHFYFRLAPGQAERGRSSSDPKCKWDLRAEGGGVVAPPSIHPSGRVYRWSPNKGPEALREAPEDLFERTPGDAGSAGAERSNLTQLLENPPTGEGNRNVWLAKVAGHYAKHLPPGHVDAYDWHVERAAAMLTPPLPEDELYKLKQSIWNTELAKQGRLAPEAVVENEQWREALVQPSEETGWLVSGRTSILCQVKVKKGDHVEMALSRWLDCDLKVLGVLEAEQGRVYEVEVLRADLPPQPAVLPGSTITDLRKLAAWLVDFGASIGIPDNIHPTRMGISTRLTRYLEAQGAEALEAVPALGWHEDSQSFITHEGIIREDGPHPHDRVRPEPAVREWAPYRYGHYGKDEAKSVLREVLAFHHEHVAAVFGSWWAATLLKPQIQKVASQFPFMALEAASESGKTTGFFSLMLQLAGNASGHSNPTRAALRDYLTAHQSGIVWMDDLDSLEAHGELLRNVTVGGSLIKKGEGNHRQVVARMRAALVVSGESLGLYGQKALLDRAILLGVPSPIERRSKKDPERPQWDDVLDLRRRHPDLTEFAGSIVQMALAQQQRVREFKELRPGAGRFADKLAVLRLGARILEALSDLDSIVPRVDRWCDEEVDQGSENALTLKLIPLALQRTGWKKEPHGPDTARRQVATPAFVDTKETGTEIVWFSPGLLADWWEREPPAGKRVDTRVESSEALQQQARALGLGGRLGQGRKSFRLVTGESSLKYWRCPPDLSRELLARSRGGKADEDGEDQSSIEF